MTNYQTIHYWQGLDNFVGIFRTMSRGQSGSGRFQFGDTARADVQPIAQSAMSR
jgi:hypothetical protein